MPPSDISWTESADEGYNFVITIANSELETFTDSLLSKDAETCLAASFRP